MILNEFAQGRRPVTKGVEWFEGLSEDGQRKVFQRTGAVLRAGPRLRGGRTGSIARSGIRPTRTPAVMVTKWRFGMEALPAYEPTKSFRLLVAFFSIADTRRGTLYCAGRSQPVPQPTKVSRDGGCVDRSGARVSRCTLIGLSHAIGLVVDHRNLRWPARDDGAGVLRLRRCEDFGRFAN
ncbi:DUF5958 family protein [Streptomyces sp. AGS-58]|uniref:DUF5958 family protein n=1 Tax=unclassified Streptomyces TaxID=2593676 RepID=UPI0035A27069